MVQGSLPLIAKYAVMAATGHKTQIVTSATQEHIDAFAEMPLQKGSVFEEALLFTLTTNGLDRRLHLTQISFRIVVLQGGNCSPDYKKPKKHAQHAAHIMLSG